MIPLTNSTCGKALKINMHSVTFMGFQMLFINNASRLRNYDAEDNRILVSEGNYIFTEAVTFRELRSELSCVEHGTSCS